MDIYSQLAQNIIKQQQTVIGPVALEQAEHIPNLHLDRENDKVTVNGDGAEVINSLIKRYKDLFGQIAVEVCKEAAKPTLGQLSKEKTPSLLR